MFTQKIAGQDITRRVRTTELAQEASGEKEYIFFWVPLVICYITIENHRKAIGKWWLNGI